MYNRILTLFNVVMCARLRVTICSGIFKLVKEHHFLAEIEITNTRSDEMSVSTDKLRISLSKNFVL